MQALSTRRDSRVHLDVAGAHLYTAAAFAIHGTYSSAAAHLKDAERAYSVYSFEHASEPAGRLAALAFKTREAFLRVLADDNPKALKEANRRLVRLLDKAEPHHRELDVADVADLRAEANMWRALSAARGKK